MRKFFLFLLAAVLLAVPCAAEQEEPLNTEVLSWRAKEVPLPIVMYHLVTDNPRYIGKFGISPAQLESDLQFLYDNNYNTVLMRDLIDFVATGKDLPENPVMLTFDDGNTSDFTFLLPLLEKFDMQAVVAVIGSAADRFTAEAEKIPNGRFPNLTWPQIIALHESGRVEIQNHSYDLHTPPLGSRDKHGESPGAYHTRLFEDLHKLQQACATYLGCTPSTFVYPLGEIGENSRAVLEELGMSGSITCREGLNTIRQGDKDCLFKLKRSNRPSNRSIEDVLKKILSE